MAEAAAAVQLVASIASLIDLGAKVVTRLHEFTSKSSKLPKSFRSLWFRLPLLEETLERIESQAEAGQLPESKVKRLKAVIDDTLEQVLALHNLLSKILPANGASTLQRASNALKSLAKEDDVQRAVEKIEKNNHILGLYQTTRLVDTGDQILAQLTELTTASKTAATSSNQDTSLALTRSSETRMLSPQAELLLHNSAREILFRFEQLPVPAKQRFLAQQEIHLIQFVEEEESKLLEEFTSFDTRQRLIDHRIHRTEGTCDWILENPGYIEWANGKCNRLALIRGPGTGKTVMAAFLAENLSRQLDTGDILAVHMCSMADPRTMSATNIMCALAGQIALSSSESMEKCKRFLKQHASHGRIEPDLLDLQDLIISMSLSTDIRRLYIIIDGLDNTEGCDELATVIDISRRARKAKMLVTGRAESLLTNALCDFSTITVDYATMSAAVTMYVEKELERDSSTLFTDDDFIALKEFLTRMSHQNSLFAKTAIHRLLYTSQNGWASYQKNLRLLSQKEAGLTEELQEKAKSELQPDLHDVLQGKVILKTDPTELSSGRASTPVLQTADYPVTADTSDSDHSTHSKPQPFSRCYAEDLLEQI